MLRPKILTTLKTYSWPAFGADALAGVTVALVALPLSIAIAIASGATPAQGLITAVVGGVLISALGGSRVQIGGPTGAFIVVVYSVIAEHGYDGLVTATFMAGCILAIAGWLRAGSLITLVPEPVVNGFTIGIGVIIGFSQLESFLGLRAGAVPADLFGKAAALWAARDTLNPWAAVLGLLTIVAIVLLRRAAPRWPGLIAAVALTSGLVAIASLPVDTVGSRFGQLPATFPAPGLPDLSPGRILELAPSALLIAFLAGIEALLSAMVADRMIGGSHRPNAEIMAQGFANLGSALFGGLPATGAIARTATNVRAGGRTPVAGIVHALVILVLLLAAAPLASALAMPALAALLMLTAWNMTEPHRWRGYLSLRPGDKVLLLLTLVLTVAVDLALAVSVGVALGLAMRLRRREVPPADWTPPDR